MEIETTALPGVLILTPRRIGDSRGWFSESWNRHTLAEHGIAYDFVQDNHSFSDQVGTIRGLHFQAPPMAQAKLVRCGQGALLDVAVDIRRGAPTYGQSIAVELSAQNGRQLLIPEGFLHGFVTRAPGTEILYKCSAPYAPATEGAVHPADPDLAIDWGIDADETHLSKKDAAAGSFAEFTSPFTWEGMP